MNYKLINRITNEETICEKVVVDRFDYYVNSNSYVKGDYLIDVLDNNLIEKVEVEFGDCCYEEFKVIATNNPNIDLPQVIDEVEELSYKRFPDDGKHNNRNWQVQGFIKGYKKSQESHPFSQEDMLDLIKSLKDYTHESNNILGHDEREPIELLEIWKSQQTKTLYYE